MGRQVIYEDTWDTKWLAEQLRLNRYSAAITILGIALTLGLHFALTGNTVGFSHIAWLLLVAMLLELFLVFRFGGPYGLSLKGMGGKYHYLAFVPQQKARSDSPPSLFPHLKHFTTDIPFRYPLYGLVIEALILADICRHSGGLASPYFPLFIYFSSLAEVVLDRTATRIIFGLSFFLAFLLILWHPVIDAKTYGESLYVIAITTVFALGVTGIILSSLARFADDEIHAKSKALRHQLEAINTTWKRQNLINMFKAIHGGFLFARNGGQLMLKKETTIALLPFCLRSSSCPFRRPDFNSIVSTQCYASSCDEFRDNRCDAGRIAAVLSSMSIPYHFVGHGHQILDIIGRRCNDGIATDSVIGISCVCSFAGEATQLLRKTDVKCLLYFPLKDGFSTCPSYLGLTASDDDWIGVHTYADHPAFQHFISQCYP